MAAQQNQIHLGKENSIPMQGMVSCLHFFVYSQVYLRQLPNQLMEQQYSFLDIVRNWVVWDFLCFGVLSLTDKGTKATYQPKLAVLGLSAGDHTECS